MKILIIHNYYQQSGGEETVFNNEIKLLEEHGHTIVKYTIHNHLIKSMNIFLLMLKTIWNFDVYNDLKIIIDKEKPDIAHFHNIFPLISPAAYYACKEKNIPTVQTLHNYRLLCPAATFLKKNKVCEKCLNKFFPYPAIIHSCYRNSRVATLLSALMIFFHRLLGTWNKQVDCYIALTEFSKRKFLEAGFASKKLLVKPNFSFSKKNFSLLNGSYALFVGRLANEKGIHTLLKAWEKLDSVLSLVIVGDGPLDQEVLEYSSRFKNIKYLGRKDSSEVLTIMKDAYCLIFPSIWYETFGMTIIEGFSVGLPVICSDLGAAASLVEEGKNAIKFQAGSAEDLIEKVVWAVNNPEKIQGMRAKAAEAFEKYYSAELNYQTLLEIYSGLLQQTK